MAITVIIGAGTKVVFDGRDEDAVCIVSVNWGFNPGRQDAFCLGSFEPSPDFVVYKPTQTLSLTGYAPMGSVYPIPPSVDCNDASTISASVSPAACDAGFSDSIGGDWFLQSYSYTKEAKDQAAQETYSLIKYKGINASLTSQGVAATRIAIPSGVTRGITMGESSVDSSAAGITFSSIFAQAMTGSVSAGSFGKASSIYHGSVSAVGGGSSDAGFVGTGSASIPYTPLYI